MGTQVENGRAFEWAISNALSEKTGFPIESSDSSELANHCFFNCVSDAKRTTFNLAAKRAVEHIFAKEKNNLLKSSTSGVIKFNSDKAGAKGDVRDVLLVMPHGTLGISCKNNHEALKHSRLSDTVDFVKKWGIDSNGCSLDYWKKVHALFGELRSIRKKSSAKFLWSELENKAERFYWPILDAWESELKRIAVIGQEEETQLCKAIIAYLVGQHDFYKVICEASHSVHIQAWNFNKTLATKQTKYPNSINAINNKNGGQYSKTLVFNHGYSLNFRIHNASSRVEPSLKFDITAIGLPSNEVYQQTIDLSPI